MFGSGSSEIGPSESRQKMQNIWPTSKCTEFHFATTYQSSKFLHPVESWEIRVHLLKRGKGCVVIFNLLDP